MKMIVCRKCLLSKHEDDFHIRRDSGKRRTDCKACRAAEREEWLAAHPEVRRKANRAHYERNKPQQRERSLAWNRANPDKIFNTHLTRTFGITSLVYYQILADQNGVCAICKCEETAIDKRSNKVRRLHVDHDHASGAVRGLLCTRCNMAVGYLKDDVQRAEAMAAYLRKHTTATVIYIEPRRVP